MQKRKYWYASKCSISKLHYISYAFWNRCVWLRFFHKICKSVWQENDNRHLNFTILLYEFHIISRKVKFYVTICEKNTASCTCVIYEWMSSYSKWRWDFCHVLCKRIWNGVFMKIWLKFKWCYLYPIFLLSHRNKIFCYKGELENAILIMWTLVWSFLHQLQINSSQGWSIRLIATKDILKTATTAETVMDNLAQNQLKYCTLFKAVF